MGFNPATEQAEVTEIALFSPSLGGGGAERVAVTLANAFAEKGLRVALVLAQAEGPYLANVSPAVRVVDLRAKRIRTSFLRLARFLRNDRPAALLTFQTHANLVAIAARSISRVPVRLIVSERVSMSGFGGHRIGGMDRMLRLLLRVAYRHADFVTVVAEAMVEELKAAARLPGERVVFIPNPVVTPDLTTLASEPPRHRFASASGPPLVLAVGRLAPQKDYTTLIEAFALLRRRADARLLILGEGPGRPALQSQIEQLGLAEHVDLPGFEANPFPYMKAASLYVLSSLFEGLPGALIQAMAVGTPVVSTDCPTGPAEILEGGRWGRLVPVGDAEALAAAMFETLQADTRPNVKLRASYYSPERAVSAHLALLEQPRSKASADS
jgi:glycosyltransferase involved in cell wall biosynthesis